MASMVLGAVEKAVNNRQSQLPWSSHSAFLFYAVRRDIVLHLGEWGLSNGTFYMNMVSLAHS